MAYLYTPALIDQALTYTAYREQIRATLGSAPADETAEKMRPHLMRNAALMDDYDQSYTVTAALLDVLMTAPATTWLVISEGWCGDAAYNVPMLHAIEKAVPEKVKLRILLRDSYPEVMDANLTDGGRSIPKLIVLDQELKELGNWGPRPAELQSLMKTWKAEGLEIKELIPKVHVWYEADATVSLQQELKKITAAYA